MEYFSSPILPDRISFHRELCRKARRLRCVQLFPGVRHHFGAGKKLAFCSLPWVHGEYNAYRKLDLQSRKVKSKCSSRNRNDFNDLRKKMKGLQEEDHNVIVCAEGTNTEEAIRMVSRSITFSKYDNHFRMHCCDYSEKDTSLKLSFESAYVQTNFTLRLTQLSCHEWSSLVSTNSKLSIRKRY